MSLTPTSATQESREGDTATPLDIQEPDVLAAPIMQTDDPKHERLISRLRLIWAERVFLFKVAVWALVLSTVFAFLIPKQYQSTVRLMPPDNQSGSGLAMIAALTGKGGSGGMLGSVAGDVLGLKTTGAMFVGILRSRTVEDAIIDRFDLRKAYSVKLYKSARKKLEAKTDIVEDKKTGIISIIVTDRDPARAAAIASQYATELDLIVNGLNTSAAHRERVFLEGRITEVKKDLETAEKELSQFSSKNSAIDIKEQGRAMVGAAAALQGELIAAQSQLQGLREIYTDDNVRVRSIQARISELQRQLQNLGGKPDSPSPSAASSSSEFVYPSIRQLPILGVTYADLYRRTAVQEAIFETLTKEYELAKVEEAKEIPSVKVLDGADIPEWKSSPPRFVIMVVGTLLAVMLGVGWVIAHAIWHETDLQDPRKAFALEIYQAAIARLPKTDDGWKLRTVTRRMWSSSREGSESPHQ